MGCVFGFEFPSELDQLFLDDFPKKLKHFVTFIYPTRIKMERLDELYIKDQDVLRIVQHEDAKKDILAPKIVTTLDVESSFLIFTPMLPCT